MPTRHQDQVKQFERFPTQDTIGESATEQFESEAWAYHWRCPVLDRRRHEHISCPHVCVVAGVSQRGLAHSFFGGSNNTEPISKVVLFQVFLCQVLEVSVECNIPCPLICANTKDEQKQSDECKIAKSCPARTGWLKSSIG